MNFDEAIEVLREENKNKDKKIKALEKEVKELRETIDIVKKKPKFYTVSEAAKTLGVSRQLIYSAIKVGKINYGELSSMEDSQRSRKFIPASEITKLIKS